MPKFLAEFAVRCNISQSAKVACIDRKCIYTALEKDAQFAAALALAREDAADRIRAEVDRRAIEGWQEPIIGSVGDYKDGQLKDDQGNPLFVRKFDSGLLARLAVAHCPEFKEKPAAAGSVNINITITPERLQQLQERTRRRLIDQAPEDL